MALLTQPPTALDDSQESKGLMTTLPQTAPIRVPRPVPAGSISVQGGSLAAGQRIAIPTEYIQAG